MSGLDGESENRERLHTSSAYLTFVALDGSKPAPVVPVMAESQDDERRYHEAGRRRSLDWQRATALPVPRRFLTSPAELVR